MPLPFADWHATTTHVKKIIVRLFTVLVMLLAFSAKASAENSYFKFTGAESYTISSGAQLFKGHVAQFEIGHEFQSGIGGSIWWSVPASLNNIGDNKATELDAKVHYHLNPKTTIGASYFFVNPNKPGEAFFENDVMQVNAESKWVFPLNDSVTLTSGIRGEYDFPASGRHCRATTGLYILPSAELARKAGNGFTFGLMTKADWDVFGGFGASSALVVKMTPSATYAFSESILVNAGYDFYHILWRNAPDARENIGVFHFGASCAF